MAEARQWTGVGHFWNAKEGSAEADRVGEEGYENREANGGQRGSAYVCGEGISAIEPNGSRQAQERDRRQQSDFVCG